jgi:hypothetical protein
MQRWPYALPNVLSAILIFASVLAVIFGLDEVRSHSALSQCTISDKKYRHMKLHVIRRTGVGNSGSGSQEL